MKTVDLRLNDILEDTPIVEFDNENTEIDKFLYGSVVGAYKYAYINADNKEQFYNYFKTYWDREIKVTRLMTLAQIALGTNLWQARIEERESSGNQTDTPNYNDDETWTFGRKDITTYGRTLEIIPDITETDTGSTDGTNNHTGTQKNDTENSNTQYSQQIVTGTQNTTREDNLTDTVHNEANNTHTRKGNETHTNSGDDTTEQSGSNGRVLKRTGNKTVEFSDGSTNKVTVYDPEKLYNYLRTDNVVNKFVDMFAPLFNDILMFDNDNITYGGWR